MPRYAPSSGESDMGDPFPEDPQEAPPRTAPPARSARSIRETVADPTLSVSKTQTTNLADPKPQSILRQLAEPFPDKMVKKAPAGKYGEYVPHSDVAQRALSIVGFYDFDIAQVIRGYAEAIKTSNNEWPARENAIVGVVCRLTIYPDGRAFSISEIGTEDNPAMSNDAENLKNAVSDAYKRCWMRLGLGLHLWCEKGGAGYWLDRQLDKHDPTVG